MYAYAFRDLGYISTKNLFMGLYDVICSKRLTVGLYLVQVIQNFLGDRL